MRATRRRQRKADPLASLEAVRSVIEKLRAALPDLIPQKDKELVRMLRAARHAQRYPATDTKRGRPGRWGREELLRVSARLSDILDRETPARISFASFVDHYLRLPDFPSDVVEALEKGEINLFEAEQFARVAAPRLGVSAVQAKSVRAELLSSHLQTKASSASLRQRVNELLRTPAAGTRESASDDLTADFEDLEDFDPYDSTHLFWEQIKQLGFAFREIRREDVTDEEIDELLKASEPILAILSRIQRRKEQSKLVKV
ncbi:MAG TPA: hypothetical protein VF668_21855 [Pyrinomonadaceae bacterium]|jgi:hypothetical protein